ncbi:MAG: phosphatidylglycerophosphatase A [Bacteroidetes bacterium]|nr:MAG: phosphatidylglycerophosphatase A [Bacteroidota bacterium]
MNRGFEKLSATAFGIGYLPLAPGTWASLAAVSLWYFLQQNIVFTAGLQLLAVSASVIIGIWSSVRLENVWGKDPSKIVIDEWAGMWITLLFLPADWRILILALLVFRILDIWKPSIIKRAEEIKGGWGVMMDDIIAGVIGNVLIRIVLWMI